GTGPKACTPVLSPGGSAPETKRSTPSTSRCAMTFEHWPLAESNWTRRTPSVGSGTVGIGVQSCGVVPATQGATRTAKLNVRPANRPGGPVVAPPTILDVRAL